MGVFSFIPGLFRKAPESDGEAGDGRLLQQYAQGSEAAFARIVDRYQNELHGFLVRSTRDGARAEELLQEVFIRLIDQAPSWKDTGSLRPWLYRVARNLAIDHARRHSTRFEKSTSGDENDPLLLEEDASQRPDAEAESSQLRTRLRRAVTELPDDQQEVLLLRHDEGLTFPEIAEVLGIPANTAKSRMRYALEALRGHLADLERERVHE